VAVVREVPTLQRVDLDLADSAALERLPRIGPALAARIVADRQGRGPFGSLEALQRVRGIGPKVAASLAALVTFSGNPRPSAVQR
jgi:competence protein ComEA